ncbi:ABC transporter ATP-binding protein [Arcobacter roscoffensis]|uniref:ABC transporter ATP-binding protein n=1 Tax=Arcobacter roscoffensis TaxID=2961520 RepID=A0ABY5E5W0_9BACT|nr:ABC transporter ATP-binding protein [Arcobacter roscoffensis]UTJ06987.1 ABC transporter ATP-binding protein [Arcobacter roscoffensis]
MLEICIENKSYKEKTVLKDINISLKKSEFISIIGPSGCGKTTLLNILASLDDDYIGELKKDSDEISFMFQDDRLIPWLSIKENLLLISKNKDENKIKEFLKLINLEEVLDFYPNSLSGGMKRRVALIRAFINEPKLIFLDEPFISLDYPTAMQLKEEFLKLCEKFNPKVVLVTHDLSEAIYFSNRIFFLSKNPATIILEFENNKNRKSNQRRVDEVKNEIFEKYPNILKGEI